MSAPTPKRLAGRLEDSALVLVQNHATLAGFALLERDMDTTVGQAATPNTPPPAPKPSIIIAAADQGRYHRLLPIRNVALSFTVRANAKTAAGNAASFESITGDLENFLDTTNLALALSNGVVAVMLAVRQAGSPLRTMGLIREQMFTVDCRVVARELTVQGAGS